MKHKPDWTLPKRSDVITACKKYRKGDATEPKHLYVFFDGDPFPAKHIRLRAYYFATGIPLTSDHLTSASGPNAEFTRWFEERGFLTTESRAYVAAQTSTGMNTDEDEYAPIDGDWRRTALRKLKLRQGQQAFKSAVQVRYGVDGCMITGCTLLGIVEAAHINPYRGDNDNHSSNGLLLRSDLHTLFDLDYIGIDPKTLTVRVHPHASKEGYSAFEGVRLKCSSKKPSPQALELRWKSFCDRLGS